MPTHLFQLLKYDVHRNTFLDTAGSAEEEKNKKLNFVPRPLLSQLGQDHCEDQGVLNLSLIHKIMSA